MALRPCGIGVLVGLPRTVDLPDQPVGDIVVAVGMLRRNGRGTDHHLGAVGLEHVAFVLTDLVGTHEHTLVAALLRDEGQTHTGVTRGRFNNGAAGLELAGSLGRVDHPDGDTVLAAAAGIEILDLGRDQT